MEIKGAIDGGVVGIFGTGLTTLGLVVQIYKGDFWISVMACDHFIVGLQCACASYCHLQAEMADDTPIGGGGGGEGADLGGDEGSDGVGSGGDDAGMPGGSDGVGSGGGGAGDYSAL